MGGTHAVGGDLPCPRFPEGGHVYRHPLVAEEALLRREGRARHLHPAVEAGVCNDAHSLCPGRSRPHFRRNRARPYKPVHYRPCYRSLRCFLRYSGHAPRQAARKTIPRTRQNSKIGVACTQVIQQVLLWQYLLTVLFALDEERMERDCNSHLPDSTKSSDKPDAERA